MNSYTPKIGFEGVLEIKGMFFMISGYYIFLFAYSKGFSSLFYSLSFKLSSSEKFSL